MNTKHDLANRIQRVYLTLQVGNTLAASFIFGINTLFLLDAGLSNAGGVRGERVLHRRDGAVRHPDRGRRRRLGTADVVPARHGDAVRCRPSSTGCSGR